MTDRLLSLAAASLLPSAASSSDRLLSLSFSFSRLLARHLSSAHYHRHLFSKSLPNTVTLPSLNQHPLVTSGDHPFPPTGLGYHHRVLHCRHCSTFETNVDINLDLPEPSRPLKQGSPIRSRHSHPSKLVLAFTSRFSPALVHTYTPTTTPPPPPPSAPLHLLVHCLMLLPVPPSL